MQWMLDLRNETLRCKPLLSLPVSVVMDLYEIRGGRLDVITEEEASMDPYNTVASSRGGGGRPTRDVSTFQRFSVGTNESLRFEPCEGDSPSPTGAEDGDEDDDDVFRDRGTEVGTLTQLWMKHMIIHMLLQEMDH